MYTNNILFSVAIIINLLWFVAICFDLLWKFTYISLESPAFVFLELCLNKFFIERKANTTYSNFSKQ